jgi:hypothetical protein
MNSGTDLKFGFYFLLDIRLGYTALRFKVDLKHSKEPKEYSSVY